jgi:GTP-binding protein Era
MENTKKSLHVAIIGKPNAGKSTLLNFLVGQKIAIVTPKVQTTRSSITGIITKGNTQLVLIDTPGIFNARSSLERAMVRCAWSNIVGTDIVIFLMDAYKEFDDESISIIDKVSSHNVPMIFVINKTDLKNAKTEAIRDTILNIPKCKDAKIFEISALKGKKIDLLIEFLASNAKPKEWLYGEDDLTNLPSRFLASEITREQLFLQLGQELPYKLTVESENGKNYQTVL